MRRLLVQTSAIQSLGVMLMLLITLIVSRFGGPGTQGSFALVKSFNDLQVAAFSLGLPPAIVIMLNTTRRGHRAAERLIVRYGICLLLLLPPINFALLSWIGPLPDRQVMLLQALLIGWGSAFFTVFAFQRALLLVHTDGPKFSLVSITPWIIIAPTAVLLLNRTPLIFEITYFIAGLGSLAVIYVLLRGYQPTSQPSEIRDAIDWPLLRVQSGNVLIQMVLFTLQPFLTNALLARSDPSLVMAGLFNIAALVVALPNLLVALVAPVLLNRWSKELEWTGYASVRRHALTFGAVGQGVALLSLPLVPGAIRLIFGRSFELAGVPTQILLLSVFAVIAGRILTPALQGLGRNDLVSWSCAMRILAIIVGALTAHFIATASLFLAIVVGWCAGEYAALTFLLLSAQRSSRQAAMAKLPC